MNLIVAVDKNWGIGKNNDLLFSIPEDMKFFRSSTMGKVVVMGRKTLESFPNSKPLKNRVNIVLTSDMSYEAEGAIVVHSMEEMFLEIGKYEPNDVYVIGGASIYEAMYDYCGKAYVTMVDADGSADKFMVNLSDKDNWEMTEQSDVHISDGIEFRFCTFDNKCPKSL